MECLYVQFHNSFSPEVFAASIISSHCEIAERMVEAEGHFLFFSWFHSNITESS